MKIKIWQDRYIPINSIESEQLRQYAMQITTKNYFKTHQEKIIDIPISEILNNTTKHGCGFVHGYSLTNSVWSLLRNKYYFIEDDNYNLNYAICDEEFPNITDNIPYADIDIYTEEEFVNWLKNYKYGDEEE